MRFLLMIHGDDTGSDTRFAKELQARREQYGAVARRAEVLRASELGPTSSATTVRVQEGSTIVTDGPYAETREALGGVFVVETASIDEALELAQALPAPNGRGGIEVRPVYESEP